MVLNHDKKTKVGIVQVNNSFSDQNYLPLSAGFLQAYAQKYAKNAGDFEFLATIYKRLSIDKALNHLLGADIVAFSTYVWNFEISKAIAERIKKERPETLIVFGGCHIPDNKEKGLESLLRKNTFIDIASTGEGEKVFKALLENFASKSWENVPSLAYLDQDKRFVITNPAPRIEDLNEVPSPYLNGLFDSLMAENPDEKWIALFETNRGCPFKCSFCDWGNNSKNRMSDYDLEERVFKEIDWFSRNNIEFVYCCNSNFGMFKERDLAIANRFAENKKKFGYPHRFSVQNTKNSTDASYKIQEVLVKSGLDKGVLLAFQSLHPPTLKAVKRDNIKLETFNELQRRFTRDGVTTFSDIILGLPLETYETFTQGVSKLIESGQHNRIQFNNLSILPNAPIISDMEKYGIETIDSDMINIHGSLGEWVDNIYEKQRLVVATGTMSREDWTKARNFAYTISLLHFDKVLQIPNIVANNIYGVSYKEIVDAFMENKKGYQEIGEVGRILSDQARAIQGGGPEYIHSQKWLDIWWPADEYALIKLATEGKLPKFYQEADFLFKDILADKGLQNGGQVISDAISLNRELLKLPFKSKDSSVRTGFNIWEIYQAGLITERVGLKEGEYIYSIKPMEEKIDSWEEWCRKVVWWGNKKGDYLHSCRDAGESKFKDVERLL